MYPIMIPHRIRSLLQHGSATDRILTLKTEQTILPKLVALLEYLGVEACFMYCEAYGRSVRGRMHTFGEGPDLFIPVQRPSDMEAHKVARARSACSAWD